MNDEVFNPDGRPRLLDAIDRAGGLAESMEFNKVYSLSDRPCGVCGRARREQQNPSVALVKVPHERYSSMLVTLCEEHAAEWEERLNRQR